MKDEDNEDHSQRYLLNESSHYGFPRTLLADKKSPPIQINGLVELFNKTLKERLRMYVYAPQDDWDKYLHWVLHVIHTAPTLQLESRL